MKDTAVRWQMEEKYPELGHPLPETVSRGQCVDSLQGLHEVLLGLEPGTTAGTGGLRPEYLICVAEMWGEDQVGNLEQLV